MENFLLKFRNKMKQAKLRLVAVEKKENGKKQEGKVVKIEIKKNESMIYFEKTNPNIYINVKKCNE
jgi:hypothetical protein